MNDQSSPQPLYDWRLIERVMFGAVIISKIILFGLRLGVELGYDSAAHLQMITLMRWLHPFVDLRTSYYAYHPSLGFLLSKTAQVLTFSTPVIGAQIISFLSVLAILFFLRSTLRTLQLLERPSAIAFLYLATGVPLQAYLLTTISLDVIIFAFACIILFLSIHIILRTPPTRIVSPATVFLGLSLGAACLTKATGFLLFPLPLFVLLFFPKNVALQIKRGVACLIIAYACIFPYYAVRYVLPTGHFFYTSAGVNAYVQELPVARALRDNDLSKFFTRIIIPHNDIEPSLYRVWRSLWRMEDRLPISQTAATLIAWYLRVIPWLVAIGGVLYYFRATLRERWYALGSILLLHTLLHTIFLVYYLYEYPLSQYTTAKGIYIASASLGILFLLSLLLELPPLLRRFSPRLALRLQQVFLLIVLVFSITNMVVPVF